MQIARLNPPKAVRPRGRTTMRPPKAAIDWNEGIALAGKGIGLFVLFTTTTNWWFYKRVREEAEKKNKD